MPRITSQCKERILDAADIQSVVGDFINFKRQGNNLVACCPFHGERTPSFHVNTARNRYHCFGCGRDGDAAQFLMEKEGMSFNQALEWLAKRFNVEIRYENSE